ncbi:MAG: T9SS type B sorting domain-containing protein, partial [Flavobacteriaceae bacterium]
ACPIESLGGVILTVRQIPEAPVLEPIYTYCFEDSPSVEDLKGDVGGSVEVFLSESGGVSLPNDTLLVHDQTYYVESFTPAGCVSLTRAETEVFISNPELISSKSQICFGEEITLSVNGVPATAQDFALANPDFELFLKYNSSSYFLRREAMSWTGAYDLIQSLGAGASMYVINSKEEENAVYNALKGLGIAGSGSIHFWLGLRQQSSLNPNNTVDEGWQWLDGRMLTSDLANWTNGEPNDYGGNGGTNVEDGSEDFVQFDYTNQITWNDMRNQSSDDGDSWPVFEFTGTTDVIWGKIDPQTGLDVIFDGVETSSIVRSPTETTTYFYEVTTNGVICRVETTIVVNPIPQIPPADDMELCDDNLDGDAYNGLVNGFDLQAQEIAILNGDTSLEVLFFLNESDTNDNPIDKTQPFTNRTNPEPIYFRVRNKTTGCVSDQNGSFSMRVLQIPPVIDIPPHYECDDLASGSDTDNITTFDLRLNDARIEALLGGTAGQYRISYHTSPYDAEDPSVNGIDSYTMPTTDNRQKTIYVRVIDNLTSLSCLRSDNRFDLMLSPLPVIEQPVITFEQCDETDGNSDGVVLTNLRSFESTISANFTNEEFSYFTDATRSAESKISAPTAYYNTDIGGNPIMNSTIFVQVISILPEGVYAPNGSCVRNAEININVAVSQIKEDFMLDFDACELPPSTAQDGKTLFPPSIFDSLTNELLREHPLFQESGVVIQYYPTLDDAALKTNPIDQTSAYENPNPKASGGGWVDEIWANVEVVGLNTISCIGLKKVANLHIERLPTAYAVTPFRECDDDDDGSYPFDTSRVYQELTQGQTNISVSYFDTNYNLLFNGVLPNPYSTNDQTIIARVENNPSNNTPSCYEETEIEFVVDDTPNFNPIPTLMLCDDSDGIMDDKAIFDTQSIETDILDGQTDIVFAYYDSNGNTLPSPLPPLFTTSSTSIRVELISAINSSCVSEGFVDFEVIKNPSFDLEQQAVLCLNEESVDIGIRNPGDDYSFMWEHIDENNTVTVVGTTPSISVSKGGRYTLTATGLGPLACTTSKSIEVLTSELAKLSEKDIVIGGFSSTENTIEILVDNLGVGDYEYAVGDGNFQDEPYFTQIRPGVQTISVRDKIGCGLSQVQVGVVGYYKYFSPNNDGINDTWQILGLKTTFNSLSNVYIYDRYGRFLARISGPDETWDGSYQGQPLPADDYWFKLELEDGRVYTGHFSLMR